MLFEHEADALAWYEAEERILTKEFIEQIPWGDIQKYPIDPSFIPVLVYMRDVEKLTDVYYREMCATPTGKDPHIRQFMDRWSTEEPLHGELLHRFLGELGYPASDKWYEEVVSHIPKDYAKSQKIASWAARCIGSGFSAVHMSWGAVNELSTLNGYQRLWSLAKHPVLEQLLRGIAREEARHAFFYWSMARIKLVGSRSRQYLTKSILSHFWTPVGQGTKTAEDAAAVVRVLFGSEEGMNVFDSRVSRRVRELPGLANLEHLTEFIAQVCDISPPKTLLSSS